MVKGQVRYAYLAVLGLIVSGLIGCTPTVGPVSSTREPATVTAVPTVSGWCEGGPAVMSSADVGCYLDEAASADFQSLDDETVIVFADPAAGDNWVGAAIIFHLPTESMLVLDRFGDVDPLASFFSNRTGLVAIEAVTADPNVMAGLKAEVQERNQTSITNEAEVRLGVAWQDGNITVFLVSVAGLAAEDGRFYCPSQTWMIGDETIAVETSCMERDPDAPVRTHFFEMYEVRGSNLRSVQVTLGSVSSNVVEVRQGEVALSLETAVYLAALEPVTNRTLLVRGETKYDLEDSLAQIEGAVDPLLLANFQAVNEKSTSLQFLFQNNNAYSVQPSESINLNFLLPGDLETSCQKFQEDYPGLGGIVTLSAIGLSEDGAQALVYVEKECGLTDRSAAYYVLAKTADEWQVTNTLEVSTELPALAPTLIYGAGGARGCGDIFVYQSNGDRSEFMIVGIDARVLSLTAEPQTFLVADYPEDISVMIDVYSDDANSVGEFRYCNDVGPDANPQSVWQAVSGSITVSTTAEPPEESCVGEGYDATVVLEDVTFALGDEHIDLPFLAFEDVRVGWCPG